MKSNSNSYLTSFNDLLLIFLLGITAMLYCAIQFMNPIQKTDADIKTKAEILVQLEWNDKSRDDLDLFIQDPNGNIMFYRAREVGSLSLDRDDLGIINDTVVLPNGETITISYNKEVGSIRGIIPGEYTVNILCFRTDDQYPVPQEIHVSITKLNPYSIIYDLSDIQDLKTKQEITICRFTLDKDGNVTNINTLPKQLLGVSDASAN